MTPIDHVRVPNIPRTRQTSTAELETFAAKCAGMIVQDDNSRAPAIYGRDE
jgi:hypothetical protein